MYVTNRRTFLKSLAAIGPAAAITPLAAFLEACGGTSTGSVVHHDSFPVRFEIETPSNSALAEPARAFVAEVTSKSNNAMQMQIFYQGQIGTGGQLFDQLQSGALQMLDSTPTLYLINKYPDYNAWNLPFAFTDVAEFEKEVGGPLGQDMSKFMGDHSGVVPLVFFSLGFRVLWNKVRPVTSIADMKGLKIRALDDGSDTPMLQALGAVPVPMASTEIYSAVQQGVVQGGLHPLAYYKSLKYSEVAKFVTILPIEFAWQALNINAAFWRGLAPDLQAIVTTAANTFRDSSNKVALEQESGLRPQLEAGGSVFNTISGADLAPFKKAMEPIWGDFIKKTGPQGAKWARGLAKDAGVPVS
jgi:tripartite ATP-independent transporter DctP family solute receptor